MKEHVAKERANLAAYEEQLKVGPRWQEGIEGLQHAARRLSVMSDCLNN